MTETTLLTTSDAAKQLDVHARTVRKWIDTFEDYIRPQINDRGHYLLDEESIERLKDIHQRLQEPNKTMKQVREELANEGLLKSKSINEKEEKLDAINNLETQKQLHTLQNTMERIGNLMEEMFHRMDRLEDNLYNLFESIEDLEHKIAAVGYDTLSPSEVHQMFEEVRKKQDQLKIELRSATFHQRLSSTPTNKEQNFLPRRQQRKSRFFNLF